jgi:threonine dehydrogenase-like Zn-dependent dehydrogenase
VGEISYYLWSWGSWSPNRRGIQISGCKSQYIRFHSCTREVNLVDIDAARLEFAKDYCADEVYQLEWQYGDSIAEAKEMATLIAEAIGQSDIIYECTGASACLQAAIYVHLLCGKISDILASWRCRERKLEW